jgi:hypothetical protein
VDVTNNLTTKLVSAGFTVTTSVGVPASSLSGYQQIWDLRYNNTTPLSASDILAYKGYLNGGGSLFVMGENMGFITRDNSIVSLISSAGGGTITMTNASDHETAQSPFTGPDTVSSLTFLAAAGTASPGDGAFIAKGSDNIGAGIVFGPGSLANAPSGTLMVVFDVNFLQGSATSDLQALTNNMIGYRSEEHTSELQSL